MTTKEGRMGGPYLELDALLRPPHRPESQMSDADRDAIMEAVGQRLGELAEADRLARLSGVAQVSWGSASDASSPEPLSEDRLTVLPDDLAEIEGRHRETVDAPGATPYCPEDEQYWPCDATRLVLEVRRLREENRLLHLSRGSTPMVEQD